MSVCNLGYFWWEGLLILSASSKLTLLRWTEFLKLPPPLHMTELDRPSPEPGGARSPGEVDAEEDPRGWCCCCSSWGSTVGGGQGEWEVTLLCIRSTDVGDFLLAPLEEETSR